MGAPGPGEGIVVAEVLGQSRDQQGAPVGIVLHFLEKEQIGLEEPDPFQFPQNFPGGSLGRQVQAGGRQAEGRGEDRLVEAAESGGDLQALRPGTAAGGDGYRLKPSGCQGLDGFRVRRGVHGRVGIYLRLGSV